VLNFGTRQRALTLLVAVTVLSIVAGCRGARRAPAGPSTVAPVADAVPAKRTRADSVRTDSLRTDSLRTDSLRRDSVRASLRADSATRVKPAVKDSAAARDSVMRVAAKKPPKKAVAAPASRNCILDFADSPPETRMLYSQMPDSTANTFIGGGFIGRCQGENNRISADSAEQFESAGIVNMYGNVVYEEPGKIRFTAAHATYFTREGRLFADGGVVATQVATGSTFRGSNIEYYRVMPGRPTPRLVAPNRPTAQIVEKDSAGTPRPPVTITADRFEDIGDTLILGWGDVIIQREQIIGRSDSSAFNKTTQQARLVRAARIRSTDTTQAFTLNGDTIDLFTTKQQLDRVLASHSATATNKELVITAERIDLRLKEQRIDEAYAFGKGRAKARTPQQNVEADSMRIVIVDQRAREVRAIGSAVALGVVDTAKIKSADRDMLRGDSLFAYFDTLAATADTARQSRIKEIRAYGNASSLFQIPSSKGPTAPPALNYVRGQRIFVQFDTGSVRDVRVDSSASGVYLEPAPDSLADSTAKGSKPPATRPATPPVKPPAKPPAKPVSVPPVAVRRDAVGRPERWRGAVPSGPPPSAAVKETLYLTTFRPRS
jgi:hypothetical protein